MYIYVPVFYVQIPSDDRRQTALDLKLESRAVVSCLKWVLGTELGFCRGAASALSCYAISMAS